MLVTMSGEKNTAVVENVPEVIVERQPAKSSSWKKYALIAVSAVLVVALVLAAILVCMYLYAQSIHDTLEYTVAFQDGNQQQVSHDMTDNTVSYHIGSGAGETWIINDLNRDIQLAKVMVDSEYQCFLLPLNRSETSLPTSVQQPPTQVVDGYVLTSNGTYVVSENAIVDTSILSNAGQQLCSGLSVKWLFSSCSANDHIPTTTNGGMTKRQTQYQQCCYSWYDYCYYYCNNYNNNNNCMAWSQACRWMRNYYMTMGPCMDNYCY